MTTYTLADANKYLDDLSANADFARHVVALRALVRDGLPMTEIADMLRGMFPQRLIALLVEAQAAGKTEPVIAA
jgi:hypothetical protein